MFDGYELEDVDEDTEAYDIGRQLEEQAQEAVSNYGEIESGSLALAYAFTFMSDVNWTEIAEHLIDAARNG